LEQIGVALEQSLLSVAFGPFPTVAQGTQDKVADQPDAVTELSEVKRKVKHPLGLFAVKLKGVARLPEMRPKGTVAGGVVKTGEF